MVKPNPERRALYRLQYPPADRPQASLAGTTYAVTEISEGGMRLGLHGEPGLLGNEELGGEVLFHDGEVVTIRGQVLRTEGLELVLQLHEGISFRRMLTEQQWLQHRYPRRYKSAD
mgnify:CR=1 FL=1